MKWIELETVLKIHNQVIESTGGTHGLRDKKILKAHFTHLWLLNYRSYHRYASNS